MFRGQVVFPLIGGHCRRRRGNYSIPVSRTNGRRTLGAIFEAALRRACALRVLPESAGT